MDIVSQDNLHIRQNLKHVQTQMSKPETPDWALLLQQVAAKQDRKAFTLLFNHFAPRLKSFGLSVLKQESLAMELAKRIGVRFVMLHPKDFAELNSTIEDIDVLQFYGLIGTLYREALS